MLLSFWYHIIKMITHNIIIDIVYRGKRQEKQKSIPGNVLSSEKILFSFCFSFLNIFILRIS